RRGLHLYRGSVDRARRGEVDQLAERGDRGLAADLRLRVAGEAERHGVGVDVAAIVELGAALDLELPGQVVDLLPRLDDPGLLLERLAVLPEERVEDVLVDVEFGHRVAELGVHEVDVGALQDDRLAGGRLVRGGRRRGRGARGLRRGRGRTRCRGAGGCAAGGRGLRRRLCRVAGVLVVIAAATGDQPGREGAAAGDRAEL